VAFKTAPCIPLYNTCIPNVVRNLCLRRFSLNITLINDTYLSMQNRNRNRNSNRNAIISRKIINLSLIAVMVLVLPATCFAGTLSFETNRLEETCNLLPANLKSQIENNSEKKDLYLSIGDAKEYPQVIVSYNSMGQISRLGFDLFAEESDRGIYRDVYLFIENGLLNFALLPDNLSIYQDAQKKKISLLIDKKELQVQSKKKGIPFSSFNRNNQFSIQLDRDFVTCSWVFPAGRSFSMKFPADIGLIKGMNKDELESDFVRKLKEFEPERVSAAKLKYNASHVLTPGLYMQEGTKFETDNFRSDIFLEQSGAKLFTPVFSPEYPVESFSNLFICNLKPETRMKVTYVLYGARRETNHFLMNKLLSYLSANHETYFGWQNNSDFPEKIKATVIFYNPRHKYYHLMIAETEKNVLFSDNKKGIEALMYLYVPMGDSFLRNEYPD